MSAVEKSLKTEKISVDGLAENKDQSTSKKENKTKKIKIKKFTLNEELIKEEAQEIKKIWITRTSKFLSEATLKRQSRAKQYLAAKDEDKALDILNKIIDRSSSTDYELAVTKTLMAKAYMADNKYSEAELQLKEALKLDILSYRESAETLLHLAQVQMISKNLKDAKTNVIKYIEIAPDNAAVAYIILASIDFQLELYQLAQVAVDKSLSLNKKPQEPWLYLAANIHYKNKSYTTAEMLLKNLIRKRQGNKNYWMSLIAVLFEQEKTQDALIHFEMAEKLGHIKTSSEHLSRAGLMFNANIPFKAAKQLQLTIDKNKDEQNLQRNFESLAGYWFAAKEFDKAVSAYEKASSFSKDGKIDLMLGQVYLETESWDKASLAFRKALSKGNLDKRAGYAFMGLGLSSFFMDDKEKAIKYFNQAKNFKTQSAAAQKWLGHLN